MFELNEAAKQNIIKTQDIKIDSIMTKVLSDSKEMIIYENYNQDRDTQGWEE